MNKPIYLVAVIYIYALIHNYNLLSLSSVACMFMASGIRGSSLRKTASPALSSPSLPTILCFGVGPHEIFPSTLPYLFTSSSEFLF